MMQSYDIVIKGGKQHERDMTKSVVSWCIDHFNLDMHETALYVTLGEITDSHGNCVLVEKNGSKRIQITISNNQPLRDFVATIVHEMVHVKQYVTGEWKGTGEREANNLQYKITDVLFKKKII